MAADCRISGTDWGEEVEPFVERLKEKSHHQHQTNPHPHRSERTRWRWNVGTGGSHMMMSASFILLLMGVLVSPVCSLVLNCDSVKSCLCGKDDDGGWRIECPNDLRNRYPVELRVQRLDVDNYYEALLVLQCNDGQKVDPWSFIKGMDLSAQQIHGKIVRLEVRYCPTVNDGWKTLLKELNLTGGDIRRFSFITDDKSDSAKNIQIPGNFFESMPNIEVLNLRDNKLTSIPNLSSLKRLQTVNFRNNELTLIPAGTFSQNTQLTSVALTNNKISELSPDAFPDSVEHLELNINQLSFLNGSSFAKLKNVKRLYLNSNPLDNVSPDTFDGMSAVEDLLLYNSLMTQFPNFNDLKKLVTLTISNQIRFTHLPKSEPTGDDITTTLAPDYLPENVLVLKNLPSLENLNLPLNHFTGLPVLENLPKLSSIDLKRNDITEIESGAFAGLPSLKKLDLSRNKIKTFGAIKASSLAELDVSDNHLTGLQNDTFVFLNSLKKLNLAKNKIGDVSHKTFEPLSYLEEVDMSQNNLTFASSPYSNANIRDDFFGDLGNRSPFRSSLNLKKIRLSHNRIDKLGFSDWSQTFIQINEIDLSFNKIRSVTANELNFISSNLTLNLENNEIEFVNLKLKFFLEDNASSGKAMRVLLSANPLVCDCLAYGLKTFSSESYDLRIKNLNCKGPPELEGKKLVEVPDNKLVCLMEQEQCPVPCSCKERTVDKTVLVECIGKNLTLDEIPKLDLYSKGPYSRWMLELNLNDNEIVDFNNTGYMKQFLNKTKHINLAGNKLTSTLFLELVAEYQPTTFSIANNPFPCDNCIGFQIPWRAFPTRISDLGNVTCRKSVDYSSNGNNFELLYVQENSKEFEKFCSVPRFSVMLVLLLVIAVIFLSCLCIGLFVTIRYGWTIKAYLYAKGWDCCLFWEKDLDADEDEGNEKLYDAFVSYSHKDEEWVLDELVNRLEGNDGFKLCLHFRDWTPGDWIPDQIVRSVDKSRRTIVILSKNFVESVWSRLEFKAAHAQALKERSNRVILILLGEDLKESDVQDDDLKMYMRMNTFMKWNDPLFWHRLKYALPHKKPSHANPPTEEEQKQNGIINKMQQRERAIKLDKLRAKLEQNV